MAVKHASEIIVLSKGVQEYFWKTYKRRDRPWMVVPEWFWRIGRYIRGETSSSNMADLDKSYKIAEERMTLLGKYSS